MEGLWLRFIVLHGAFIVPGVVLMAFSTTPAWFFLGLALVISGTFAAAINYITT